MAFTPDPWTLPEPDEPSGPRRPGFGDVLAAIVRALRENARTCIALSLPAAVLLGAGSALMESVSGDLDVTGDRILASFLVYLSAVAAGIGTFILATIVAAPPAYAGLSALGHRAVAGATTDKPDAVSIALVKGPRAIGAFVLVTAAVMAGPAAGVVVALALSVVSAEAAAAAGVLLAFGLLFFPGMWLFVRYYLAVPVITMEDTGASASLGRSAELVSGGWWWIFGLIVVTTIVAATIGAILAAPFGSADNPVLYAIGQMLSGVVSVSVSGITLGAAYAARSLPAD